MHRTRYKRDGNRNGPPIILQVHIPTPAPIPSEASAGNDTESRNDHFRRLQDSCQSGEEKYDASILTMAPALLGLSITFIKDVVALKDALWMWMLYGSWLLLAISTLSVVVSFRLSSAAMRRDISRMVGVWHEPYSVIQSSLTGNWKDVLTRSLNNIAGGTFVSGLILMALFVALNINASKERSMTKPTQDQRGLTVPPMRPASAPVAPASPPLPAGPPHQGNSAPRDRNN